MPSQDDEPLRTSENQGQDMKKVTKGVVAAGLGATLLVGGTGTLAYWTDSQTVTGGAINAGNLRIIIDGTNTGCGAWTLDTGESPASTYNVGDPIVPGDVLSRTCNFTIVATGNHLRATLGVSAASFSGTNTDFGGKLTAAISGTAVNNVPGVTSITDDDNGKKLTTTVTVTFDSTAGNTTKLMQSVLDTITVTATQVHA
jgi:alternate signal-mediated exported protein